MVKSAIHTVLIGLLLLPAVIASLLFAQNYPAYLADIRSLSEPPPKEFPYPVPELKNEEPRAGRHHEFIWEQMDWTQALYREDARLDNVIHRLLSGETADVEALQADHKVLLEKIKAQITLVDRRSFVDFPALEAVRARLVEYYIVKQVQFEWSSSSPEFRLAGNKTARLLQAMEALQNMTSEIATAQEQLYVALIKYYESVNQPEIVRFYDAEFFKTKANLKERDLTLSQGIQNLQTEAE